MPVHVDYLVYQPALRLRTDAGQQQVYDPVRRKYVALTPEEHVRQLVLQYFLSEINYPLGRIRSEIGIVVNGMPRRCDIVVFDRALQPWLLVECKSPKVALTQGVADQAARYNLSLRAPYLAVTNGASTYCCEVDLAAGSFFWLDGFPGYGG